MALARRVTTKIEEGDFRGAVRLVSLEDVLADFSDDTYTALKSKHPLAHPETCIPPHPTDVSTEDLEVTASDIIRAIRSFPNGSAGGLDKLHPQHLKDMLQSIGDDSESPLLSALVNFCLLVLRGDTPVEVRPFFFGASLVALKKKCGGVRPIAVGCTLRRLVAEVTDKLVVEKMALLLSPHQLGYGVRGGA